MSLIITFQLEGQLLNGYKNYRNGARSINIVFLFFLWSSKNVLFRQSSSSVSGKFKELRFSFVKRKCLYHIYIYIYIYIYIERERERESKQSSIFISFPPILRFSSLRNFPNRSIKSTCRRFIFFFSFFKPFLYRFFSHLSFFFEVFHFLFRLDLIRTMFLHSTDNLVFHHTMILISLLLIFLSCFESTLDPYLCLPTFLLLEIGQFIGCLNPFNFFSNISWYLLSFILLLMYSSITDLLIPDGLRFAPCYRDSRDWHELPLRQY